MARRAAGAVQVVGAKKAGCATELFCCFWASGRACENRGRTSLFMTNRRAEELVEGNFFGPGVRMCCVLTSMPAAIFAAKQAIMPVQNMLAQKKCLAWRAEVMGEARRRPRGAPNQMMHRGGDVGDRSQRSKH